MELFFCTPYRANSSILSPNCIVPALCHMMPIYKDHLSRYFVMIPKPNVVG